MLVLFKFQFVVMVLVVAGVLIPSCRCCHMVVLAILFLHAQQEGRVLRLISPSRESVVFLNTNWTVAGQWVLIAERTPGCALSSHL